MDTFFFFFFPRNIMVAVVVYTSIYQLHVSTTRVSSFD